MVSLATFPIPRSNEEKNKNKNASEQTKAQCGQSYTEDVDRKARSLDVLRSVQELIGNPDSWSATQLAEDGEGRPVHPQHSSAIRWSITGALIKFNTTILAINAITQVTGRDLTTIQLRLTHKELLSVLISAIRWMELWRDEY